MKEQSAKEKTNLTTFLRQFNRFLLFDYIREIEWSIELTDNNANEWNKIYSTGYSPHFYDGTFSFEKTCKHIKFSYLCGFNPLDLSNFTFKINETMLSFRTKEFLYKIQEYGFYTNTHDKFIECLNKFNSPYITKTNVLFMGNSHLRQLMESIFCVVDENVDINAIDDVIKHYMPNIQFINDEMNNDLEMSYSNLRCDSQQHLHKNTWNINRGGTYTKALQLNQSMMDTFSDLQIASNITRCHDSQLYVNFGDKSNLLYSFMHFEENKTLSYYYNKSIYENNLLNKNIIVSIINNLDVVIFNSGNGPHYDFGNLFDNDMHLLMRINKDIKFIVLSYWFSDYLQYCDQSAVSNYSNVFCIHWKRRFNYVGNFNLTNAEAILGHPCQPGLPEHAMLSVTNLINLLVEINRSN